PAGAVTEPTTVSMETTATGPYEMGLELLAWTDAGPVEQFDRHMILSLSYSDRGLSRTEAAKLWIYRDGEPLKVVFKNLQEQRITGATDHFSAFIIADL
ncbi:MAG TPA: hypothetical protein VMK65_04760, partial [Longimicrobiales bacterium]|nr:hypothetical protein [Longimicrobiales bacterium]